MNREISVKFATRHALFRMKFPAACSFFQGEQMVQVSVVYMINKYSFLSRTLGHP